MVDIAMKVGDKVRPRRIDEATEEMHITKGELSLEEYVETISRYVQESLHLEMLTICCIEFDSEFPYFFSEEINHPLWMHNFILIEDQTEYRTDMFGFRTNDDNWKPGKWLI